MSHYMPHCMHMTHYMQHYMSHYMWDVVNESLILDVYYKAIRNLRWWLKLDLKSWWELAVVHMIGHFTLETWWRQDGANWSALGNAYGVRVLVLAGYWWSESTDGVTRFVLAGYWWSKSADGISWLVPVLLHTVLLCTACLIAHCLSYCTLVCFTLHLWSYFTLVVLM